jgi:hypothetical protein
LKWTAFDEAFNSTDVTNSLDVKEGFIQLDGKTEDGTFGGSVRAKSTGGDANWVYAWWQPIKQVRFVLGKNDDTWYGKDAVAGWDFHGTANNYAAIGNNFYHDTAFAGGTGQGASVVITPLDGLEVVFMVPVGLTKEGISVYGDNANNTWKHFILQAGYTLENVGIITLTYKSGTNDMAANQALQTKMNQAGYVWTWDDKEGITLDVGKFYASFQLKMIENLALHFGVNYNLPAEFGDFKYNSPIALGLGADYTAGDFGIKARLAFLFAGNLDLDISGQDPYPEPFKFDIGIQPYYDLGILKAYLSLGMALTTDTEDNDGNTIRDMYADFYVNPYITKAVGNGTFFAGAYLQGKAVPDTGKKSKEKWGWGVPVGLRFAF